MRRYYLIIASFFIIEGFSACERFLDVGDPVDKVASEYVYGSNSSAIAVLNGIYYELQKDGGIGHSKHGGNDISTIFSLFADECDLLPTSIYKIRYTNTEYFNYWTSIYRLIYRVNTAIEGISGSTMITSDVKDHLLGECKFIRAFLNFYLLNIYGEIPIIITSDFKINESAARRSVKDVYEQIIIDLSDAERLLSDKFLGSDVMTETNERIRPNKWVAKALLSRAYLYAGKYTDAVQKVNEIIANNNVFELTNLDDVFLKNSKEAIWQLQPYTDDGQYLNTLFPNKFILVNGKPDGQHSISVSSFLLNSFEQNDQRKMKWLGVDSSSGNTYYYFYKYKAYKPGIEQTEYITVLRLAEQYLIRAEARLKVGDLEGGRADLNIIRKRAGLDEIKITSLEALSDFLLQERRVELFAEWGHRWFDLKRLNRIDDVMKVITPIKGGIWEPYKKFGPIPIDDIKINKNLIQNDGYPSA